MSWQDFAIVAPLVAGILTACGIMVIDLIRPGRPAVAVASALIGLAITAGLTVVAGASPGSAFNGAYRVDALTTFLDLLFVAIIAMTVVFGPDYLVPRGLPVAEYATILVFAMTGAMLIAASTDLLVLFLGLELMVLPGYMLAAFHKTDAYSTEGAHQVLPARLVQLGDLPVRARVRVGPDRHDPRRRRRRSAGGHCRRDRTAVAGPGDGPRLHDHRRRVQDRRGAVPLLDTGRVPGLADPGHRLPVRAAQGRCVRAHPAAVRRDPRAALRLVAAGDDRAGHADHDAREPGRPDPGQRQANARVQLDRPHRLHAGRAGGVGRRRPGQDRRPGGAPLLWGRVRVHEPRRVRGRGGAPEAGGRDVGAGDVRRARPARAMARRS